MHALLPYGITVAFCLADFYGLHVSLLSLPDPPKDDSGIPPAYFRITLLTLSLVFRTFYSNGLLVTESRSLCLQILAGRRVH